MSAGFLLAATGVASGSRGSPAGLLIRSLHAHLVPVVLFGVVMPVREIRKMLSEVLVVQRSTSVRSGEHELCRTDSEHVRALDFRLFFARPVAASNTCRVSFDDGSGITHTVTVAASSLFEAAALAVAEFKKCGFALAEVGTGTRLKVVVEPATATHELTVGKLQAWLDSNGKSPREQAIKVKLRQLLGRS